jgi:hypothetical protein
LLIAKAYAVLSSGSVYSEINVINKSVAVSGNIKVRIHYEENVIENK